MYTKLEIETIFHNVTTVAEFERICETIKWLIEQGFLEGTLFIYYASLNAFRRIYKLGNYE